MWIEKFEEEVIPDKRTGPSEKGRLVTRVNEESDGLKWKNRKQRVKDMLCGDGQGSNCWKKEVESCDKVLVGSNQRTSRRCVW